MSSSAHEQTLAPGSEPAEGRGLPLGIGVFPARTLLALLGLSCVVAFGLYAYSVQLMQGLVTSGMRDLGTGGAAWGLYITFDVVFIGVSFAGVTIAALIRLFGIEDLKPLARIAELLTIVCLLLGGMVVLADLGRPLHGLLNLPRVARPMSPFFGTFTMVIGGYLFASLVYFYLAGRADAAYCAQHARRGRFLYRLWASGYQGTAAERMRHEKTSFWMSIFILPLLVTAHSTLGFIFGIQAGRPGWFSALQAPAFVVMAGVSGIGVLIVIAAILRRALHLEEQIRLGAFRLLGNMLWVLVAVYGYFMIAEELTMSYAASAKERAFTHEVVLGHYAGLFWTVVGSLVLALGILFVQFVTHRTSIGGAVVAGLLVNVAAVLKRYLLVVPSQTHGMLLPYREGSYAPSWVELGVVLGLVALGCILYIMFVKVFPIVPVVGRGKTFAAPVDEPLGRSRLRVALTALSLVFGFCFSVVGFALSARVGTKVYLDPLVPFSPVLFITGVIMIFYSAAVYETAVPVRSSEQP